MASLRRRSVSPEDRVRASLSPAAFSDVYFGWTPFPYQEEVMDAILLDGKRRIAWVAGRRSGKTETVANIALQAAVKEPGKKVAIFAPSFRQARILSGRVKYHLSGSPFRDKAVVDRNDELRLRFGHDERGRPVDAVIFTFSIEGKVRGEGADMLIVDESAFCTGEDYRNKVFPFVADRPNAVVIHISTIWADDDHFMDAYREFGKSSHGAVFHTPSRRNPNVTEEMLAEFRRTMLDSEFRREYECELVAESGVFDRRLLAPCLRDYELCGVATLDKLRPKRHHRYFVGVDWGKKQDRAVIAAVEQGTQDKANPARLVFLQVYPPDPDNPRHYTRVLDDVKRVAKHLGAERVYADEGEGAYQGEELERDLGRNRFEGYRFTGGSRDALVDKARALVERRALVLPKEPEDVRKAFANVYRGESGYAHTSRQTKDLFDAIVLALHGVTDADAAAAREPMRIETPSSPYVVGWSPPLTREEQLRVVLPEEVWHMLE